MSAGPAADVAVVGLGGLGSAAACWAARMGARVVGLEPLGASLPLTVSQEQISYLAADDLDRFRPDRFPVWIWHGARTFASLLGRMLAEIALGRTPSPDLERFHADRPALAPGRDPSPARV
jgi:glycine/D-amino acid oxidase-like deaminating enzyme